MPRHDILEFNRGIIDATADLVCAYKPNLAFYEAFGLEGLVALEKTVKYIPEGIPVIGDAKRGDIGNTARRYAEALFSAFGFDAATLNPYLGYDSVEPFLEYPDKGVFILCRTSNPGALDFQALRCGDVPLYEVVAQKAKEWDRYGNIGLVVGATYPEELRRIRQLCPQMPLLIPGLGAQGGTWLQRFAMGSITEVRWRSSTPRGRSSMLPGVRISLSPPGKRPWSSAIR
jgi:orotidine-5'-phosphate decarboxylase